MSKFDFIEISRTSGKPADINDVGENFNKIEEKAELYIASSSIDNFWSGLKTWVNFATTVRNSILTGLSTATNAVITTTDTIISAIGKLQAQITALFDKTTFIYKCTGAADSTAIATIINNFFNNGTAMTMNLIVTGTEGIEYTNTYYAMHINASNARGAICNLDFSNCYIPKITTGTQDFIFLDNSSANLNITGLVVNTTRYGINASGFNGTCNFNNCNIFGANRGALLTSSSYIRFNDCNISTNGDGGVYSNSSNISLSNCNITGNGALYLVGTIGNTKFSNCIITGDTYITTSKNNSFSNCIMGSISLIGNNDSMFVNCIASYVTTASSNAGHSKFSNCTIAASSSYNGVSLSGTSNFDFSNCNITATSTATNVGSVHIGSSGGICNFVGCKIIGGAIGMYISTSNTAIAVKLTDCAIKGTSTADINQVSAASTIKWNVKGCSFSRSSVYINGSNMTVTSSTANEYVYMPAYANLFSQTIS